MLKYSRITVCPILNGGERADYPRPLALSHLKNPDYASAIPVKEFQVKEYKLMNFCKKRNIHKYKN